MQGGTASIVNYDPKQPTLKSLVPWANPSLMKVFFSFEFWFYSIIHLSIVFLTITDVLPLLDVDWKAAGAFQYFTTFFLTFYNGNCYARYQKLYLACTELMDATLLFVREMTICFKDETTWKHRLQATKWLLAAVNLFFLGVCGDKLSMKGWSEVVKKGLLTKPEAQMLIKYPGPEIVPILTTWTMICVADGLEKPCFHEKRKPEWPQCRIQKIAHLHNRLDRILIRLMSAYREISETMAQPIPFAYWHLMNLVFTLNFMLLALILASFRHWMTIVPYAMALMTFMGLREVSNQLADPFGDDIVDFPLAKYLDYTFDHSVCLLTSFSAVDAYERVRKQVKVSPSFDDRQIKRSAKEEDIYNDCYVAHVDGVFIWEKDQPLQEAAQLYANESLQDHLRKALAGIPIGDYGGTTAYVETDELIHPVDISENHQRWLAQAIEDVDILSSFPPGGLASSNSSRRDRPAGLNDSADSGAQGVVSIVRSLGSESEVTVTRACSALQALLMQNRDNQRIFEDSKGLEALAHAMEKHPTNVQVLRSSMGAVECFVEGHESRWRPIEESGVLAKVAGALERYPESSNIQEGGIRLFCCLANASDGGKTAVVKLSGLELTMQAMKSFTMHPTLQEHCMIFLSILCASPIHRHKVSDIPSIQKLVRYILDQFPGNDNIQVEGSRILLSMTKLNAPPAASALKKSKNALGETLNPDRDLEASRPLDRPDRSQHLREKGFQWGNLNHGRHDHTPQTRAMREEDAPLDSWQRFERSATLSSQGVQHGGMQISVQSAKKKLQRA